VLLGIVYAFLLRKPSVEILLHMSAIIAPTGRLTLECPARFTIQARKRISATIISVPG
jgi:hypothetical protein